MMAVSGKRRSCELENDNYNIEMEEVYENSFKKSRVMSSPQQTVERNCFQPNILQENNIDMNNDAFLNHYYESRIYSINTEHDKQAEMIDKQVEVLVREQEMLLRQQHEVTQENKILTKGIQIQETKLRELQGQQGQMIEMLQHAVHHINSLEQVNAQLQQEIELYRSGKKSHENDFHDCSYY